MFLIQSHQKSPEFSHQSPFNRAPKLPRMPQSGEGDLCHSNLGRLVLGGFKMRRASCGVVQRMSSTIGFEYEYGGFLNWGYPHSWMVYKGKSMKIPLNWMIWGYPHFRKPPYGGFLEWSYPNSWMAYKGKHHQDDLGPH